MHNLMERNKNANDWRSQLDPKVRTEVLWIIAEWLKTYNVKDDLGMINNAPSIIEERFYTQANDENDYIRKLIYKMHGVETKLQLGSFNRTNTQDSARVVMNQAQSLPTSLSYTQTPRSQQWLLHNPQTNLNLSRSSGLPIQFPILESMAENVNSHVGKGVQINSLQSSQRQRQVMGQQLPQHQRRVHSSHQQQMVVLSEDRKRKQRENLLRQLMNVLNKHKNPLLLGQDNREQQGAFNFEVMAQHNSRNLQHMYQLPQRLNTASASLLQQQKDKSGGQSGNSSVYRSSLFGTQSQKVEQSQPMVSQQYLVQQQHQDRSLPKHLDSVLNDTQRFQAASSFRQNQNIAELQTQLYPNSSIQDSTRTTVNANVRDWQEETYQKIKALKEMHLHFMNAILRTVEQKLMQNVGDTQILNNSKWYFKNIIAYLNVERSYISENHRDFFSQIENDILRMATMVISTMQQGQRQIQSQQTHQATLQYRSPQVHVLQSLKKDQINSGLMTSNQIGAMSSVSGLNSTSQIIKTQSMQKRPNSEPRDENNIMASSRNVMVPSPGSNLQVLPSPRSNLQPVHSLNAVQSSMVQQQEKQLHYGQMQEPQEVNQQVQVLTSHQTNEMNDVETGLLQQPLLLSKNQLLLSKHQLPKSFSNDLPLDSAPKRQDYTSSQFMDQQTTVNQTISNCGSPIVDLSSILVDIENFIESPADPPLASSPKIQDYSSSQFMDQQTTVNQTISNCGSPIVDLSSILVDIENFIESPADPPLASSPKIQDYSSSQFMDQQTTVNQTISNCGSPIVDLSSILVDIENFIESPADPPLASSPKIQDYSSSQFMDQQTTVNQTISNCGSPIVDLSSILVDIENFIESPADPPLASSPKIHDYSSSQFMDQQTTVNQTISNCGSPIVDLSSILVDIENFIESPADPPLASSPKIQDYSSSQFMDQQTTVNQTITTCDSPDLSSVLWDIERFIESPVSDAQSLDSSVKLDTPEQTPFTDPPEAITERPIDRLIKAVQQESQKSLGESVSQMSSVITMADRIAGSFHPSGRSQAGLGVDLSETTKFSLQKRNLMTDGETNQTKRLKRSISTLPRDITSQSDSFNHFSSLESEFDSIISSFSNANKIESGCVLLQEIREINGRFVETVVEKCSEDSSGTIVKCTYTPVALTGTLKDHYYNSGEISQIQPLRVLVPANYPSSSPIFLEEFPPESSEHKHEDLWSRTKLKFSISMKELPEPVSLKQIAQTWNDSARETMLEYAERYGGGTFSSK